MIYFKLFEKIEEICCWALSVWLHESKITALMCSAAGIVELLCRLPRTIAIAAKFWNTLLLCITPQETDSRPFRWNGSNPTNQKPELVFSILSGIRINGVGCHIDVANGLLVTDWTRSSVRLMLMPWRGEKMPNGWTFMPSAEWYVLSISMTVPWFHPLCLSNVVTRPLIS